MKIEEEKNKEFRNIFQPLSDEEAKDRGLEQLKKDFILRKKLEKEDFRTRKKLVKLGQRFLSDLRKIKSTPFPMKVTQGNLIQLGRKPPYFSVWVQLPSDVVHSYVWKFFKPLAAKYGLRVKHPGFVPKKGVSGSPWRIHFVLKEDS